MGGKVEWAYERIKGEASTLRCSGLSCHRQDRSVLPNFALVNVTSASRKYKHVSRI
jgi:hypothetical protein